MISSSVCVNSGTEEISREYFQCMQDLEFFNFFLGGTPFLAPQSAESPKMTTPALPMTQLFYCRILFHTKNVDVCKKLELNPLRFDREIRV